jgi:polyisoprenoid-binding protein YceI
MALERWEADLGHSGIHFSVRHMVVSKVRGQFASWSASVLEDVDDPSRDSVEATIDVSSITTGVAERDRHLKSADFLDVASHPRITFRSTRVERRGERRLRIAGNLTIRGVTRNVVLDGEDNGRTRDPWGHERAGFSVKVSLDRTDFGLTWSQLLEAGGMIVGDRVDIEIEVEAVRQAATTPAVVSAAAPVA